MTDDRFYTLDELREAFRAAGFDTCELEQASSLWFLLCERQRHCADLTQVREDLHAVRNRAKGIIAGTFREFLLHELSRHECDIAKLDAAICCFPKGLVSRVSDVPLGWVRVDGKETGG